MLFGLATAAQAQENGASIKSAVHAMRQEDTLNSAELAQECLALVAANALHLGDADTPTRLRATVAALIATSRRDESGLLGWGRHDTKFFPHCDAPGAWDAFDDGTCNPADTNYTYTTALAVTCVARAATALQDKAYAALAAQVLTGMAKLGTTVRDCQDCFYYWYSDNPNDFGRFVRNTNVLMGMANAWTYIATRDKSFLERARQTANAELREVAAGNHGYYGIDDSRVRANPDYERNRIENHTAYIAKALSDIGAITGDQRYTRAAASEIDTWLACAQTTCPTHSADLKFAPCFVKDISSNADAACNAAQTAMPAKKPYQLWAILDEEATAAAKSL